MPTKLLFSFLFISLLVGAQTTHQLGWGNTGSDANQQLTINVGDTVEWTWGAGTHNLVSTSGVETFDSGYNSSGFVWSHWESIAGKNSKWRAQFCSTFLFSKRLLSLYCYIFLATTCKESPCVTAAFTVSCGLLLLTLVPSTSMY